MQLNNYDIVGYKIISPLHFSNLISYATREFSEKQSINILVIVSRGPWTKNILQNLPDYPERLRLHFVDEDELGLLNSPVWPLLLLLKPLLYRVAKYIGLSQTLICSTTMTGLMLSASNWYRTCRFKPIILDEGIGSFNTNYLFREAAKRQSSNKLYRIVLNITFRTLWKHVSFWGGERVSLFSFKDGKPLLDSDVSASYRSTFLMSHTLRGEDRIIQPNTFLILTQPIDEPTSPTAEVSCTTEELLTTISAISHRIRTMGGVPLIKPHPSEAPGKYESIGSALLDYEGPVEELFASSTNISEVWGFSSTSLILASSLFGIKARVIGTGWSKETLQSLDHQAATLFAHYTELLDLDCD